jgi:hypothetical protein
MIFWNKGFGEGAPYEKLSTISDPSILYDSNSGLDAGKNYRFKVVAVNEVGPGEPSDYLEILTANEP